MPPSRLLPHAALTAASLADVRFVSGWLDDPQRPAAVPPLTGKLSADLVVVGGGFAGLWTAVLGKLAEPTREVVLLEGARIGWAASGRNGGFVSSSLTHGMWNGSRFFADELPTLVQLGHTNYRQLTEFVETHQIECSWETSPNVWAASRPWHVDQIGDAVEQLRAAGYRADALDAAQVRALLDSPTFIGGVLSLDDGGLVNPAQLAWELGALAQRLGVDVFEHTPVTHLSDHGVFATVHSRGGSVRSPHVVLATNGFRSPLRAVRHRIAPVYNYALMTQPLTHQQRDRIGWLGREGFSGMEAEFHYYRLTDDNRILWGGPHTDYMYGNGIARRHEIRPRLYASLADHFFKTFPQLDDVSFSHAWGGVIDVCSRAAVYFERSMSGKVVAAQGFSGQGVASTHFAANVMLDLLSGRETELTELSMVRQRPLPFPPEPARSLGVAMTKWSIGGIDRHDGQRNRWLRTLDRVGIGFDG